MPRITRLRELRGGTVAVDLDGAEWRVLPADAVVRSALHEGVDLDRERLRLLRQELRRSEGMARAARALRHRDLSARRLDERLTKAGIAPAARRETLAALTAAGIVDDRRVAAAYAQALAARHFGDAAIRERLHEQALPDDAIEQALERVAPEAERALRVAAYRGRTAATARYLARRGFDEAAVEAAVGLPLADEA